MKPIRDKKKEGCKRRPSPPLIFYYVAVDNKIVHTAVGTSAWQIVGQPPTHSAAYAVAWYVYLHRCKMHKDVRLLRRTSLSTRWEEYIEDRWLELDTPEGIQEGKVVY